MNTSPAHFPLFPPQVMEEVTPDLSLVYVVPVRNNTKPWQMADRLQYLAGTQSIEVIFVIHSYEYDGDEVKAANLDFYWEMEEAHRNFLEKAGIRIHLVNYIGLNQKWYDTLLPFFIGMDEAAQRLKDAGNMHGVIALLEGAEWVEANFSDQLINTHVQNPELAAATSEWEYGLFDEEINPETNEAIIKEELRQRTHSWLLQYAGYTAPGGLNKFQFSIKVWVYDKMRAAPWPSSTTIHHLLHWAAVYSGRVAAIPEAKMHPLLEAEPHHYRLRQWMERLEPEVDDRIPSLACYEQLQSLIKNLEAFYQAYGLNGYQYAIANLPQPVVGFLTEMSFFEEWQQMRSKAGNFEQFKRAFLEWLHPGRVSQLLAFSAEHFRQQAEVTSVAGAVLAKHYGLRSSVMDAEQMLQYFRNINRGMEVKRKEGRA